MTIRQMNYIPAALLLACTLWGCASENDSAPSVTAAGKHPADWYTAHRQAYSVAYLKDGATQCRNCHGSDLMGGITAIGCSTTSCHAGGHPPRPVPHALPFTSPAVHGPTAKANLIYCQGCHGQAGGPGTNPRFNQKIGSYLQGCATSGCHNLNSPTQSNYTSAAHALPWSGHNTAGNLLSACGLCHGIDLLGGNGAVGQSCKNCHVNMTALVPPVAGQCTSCHGKPPTAPAHTAHNAIASLNGLCSPCHSGAGTGTALHGNGTADIAFATSFNAKSGTAVINPDNTCANVSCHGGVTTPQWDVGVINPLTQCASCHVAGTSQYNSYNSGEHSYHITTIGLPCTDCHDMSVSSGINSHFSNMATPAFELNPALTIRTPVNYSGGSCAPGNNPSAFSIGVCHGSKNW